jgi:hypothetical protein
LKRTGAYRLLAVLVACAAVVALVCARGAGAQQPQPVDVYQAPSIEGTAQSGQTLTARGGAWRGPRGTQVQYMWWRCPSASSQDGCIKVSDNALSYQLGSADVSQFLFVVLYAQSGRSADYMISAPSSRVAPAAAPAPAPTATPTATPAPTAAPAPTFVATPEPTPVPNLGAVLGASRKNPRVLKPFPVVRMRGRLTTNGARVTLFSVRAPKGVRIAVSCSGPGCPKKPWMRAAAKGRLTRIGAFERTLPRGMRITVVISRKGYVGKRSVFLIRRGAPPLRYDGCLNAGGRKIVCPAGAR